MKLYWGNMEFIFGKEIIQVHFYPRWQQKQDGAWMNFLVAAQEIKPGWAGMDGKPQIYLHTRQLFSEADN